MSYSGDLEEQATLFVTSHNLQSIAIGIKKIIDKEEVKNIDFENFEWGGDLIGQICWDSEHYNSEQSKRLTVLATNLRPQFTDELSKYKLSYDRKFSEMLYQTLKSSGKKVELNKQELTYSHQIFQSMAESILIELQNLYEMGRI